MRTPGQSWKGGPYLGPQDNDPSVREQPPTLRALLEKRTRSFTKDSAFGNGDEKRGGSLHTANGGFTLLELLTVVAVLAIIAGGIVLALSNTQETANIQIARKELVTIKDAILQFKQDTGYLPKQGPFRLATQGGSIPNANLPPSAGATPAEQEAWFDSPANFWLLFGRDREPSDPCASAPDFRSPLCGSGHPLETWNPDTRRGWRGPYLTRFGEGLVDIGDGLQPDGSGNPLGGTAALREMRGVADPFVALPVPSTLDTIDNQLLDWRTVPGDPPHPRWGRPYLVFDLNDPGKARIVSMGPNSSYDSTAITNCPEHGGDDLVLCVLR